VPDRTQSRYSIGTCVMFLLALLITLGES